MPKPELHWTGDGMFDVLAVLEDICERGGVASLMYGGYGYYYKISWVIDGQKGYASAETLEQLAKLAGSRLQGR